MQSWQHVCKLHVHNHSLFGLDTWLNLLLMWLKIRAVPENLVSWGRQMLNSHSESIQNLESLKLAGFKSTAPELVVTRIWKLRLQQNKKKIKKATAKYIRQASRTGTSECISLSPRFLLYQWLPSAFWREIQAKPSPVSTRSSSDKGRADCEKDLQRCTRTELALDLTGTNGLESPTTNKALDWSLKMCYWISALPTTPGKSLCWSYPAPFQV